MKIKICGIKTPEHAIAAANAGADFVGMIFAEQSSRFITVEEAKAIVASLKNTHVTPVAVFAEQTADKIIQICNEAKISVAQLHGDGARTAIQLLPKSFRVINAVRVSPDGKIYEPEINLRSPDDLILFDAEKAGGGKPFAWKNFHYNGKHPWFLSGGLNLNNVTEAIGLLHPDGVDVSSGVEINGHKDPELIKKFVQVVRDYENRHSR